MEGISEIQLRIERSLSTARRTPSRKAEAIREAQRAIRKLREIYGIEFEGRTHATIPSTRERRHALKWWKRPELKLKVGAPVEGGPNVLKARGERNPYLEEYRASRHSLSYDSVTGDFLD